jgi:hypothetical protein
VALNPELTFEQLEALIERVSLRVLARLAAPVVPPGASLADGPFRRSRRTGTTRRAGQGRSTTSSPRPEVQRPGRRDLGHAIAAYLAGHACGSQVEIARAIRARDEEVRERLRADPRFQLLGTCRSEPAHHPNAHCWSSIERLVPTAGTPRGRDGSGAPDPEPICDQSAQKDRRRADAVRTSRPRVPEQAVPGSRNAEESAEAAVLGARQPLGADAESIEESP